MKKLTTALAALFLITMPLSLLACGKPTLDEWYAKNEASLTEAEDNVNSTDVGCTLDITLEEGNVFAYRYTLTEALDAANVEITDAFAVECSILSDSWKDKFADLRTQIMNETSAENITIRLAILNPDGTELYVRDFAE